MNKNLLFAVPLSLVVGMLTAPPVLGDTGRRSSRQGIGRAEVGCSRGTEIGGMRRSGACR